MPRCYRVGWPELRLRCSKRLKEFSGAVGGFLARAACGIKQAMDPYIRIGLTVGVAIFIKSLILGWWERFKARKAREPIQLQERNGVFVPWGTVQKVQHYGGIIGLLYLAQIAVLLAAVFYVWAVGPIF